MSTQPRAIGARAALTLDYPMSLGVFDKYADAQQAVDTLSDQEFPVQNCLIVGTDLRQLERVTGRLTWGRVLLGGALSGIWLGLFVGLIFALFDAGNNAPAGVLHDPVRCGVRTGVGGDRLRHDPRPARLHVGEQVVPRPLRDARRAQGRPAGARDAPEADRLDVPPRGQVDRAREAERAPWARATTRPVDVPAEGRADLSQPCASRSGLAPPLTRAIQASHVGRAARHPAERFS